MERNRLDKIRRHAAARLIQARDPWTRTNGSRTVIDWTFQSVDPWYRLHGKNIVLKRNKHWTFMTMMILLIHSGEVYLLKLAVHPSLGFLGHSIRMRFLLKNLEFETLKVSGISRKSSMINIEWVFCILTRKCLRKVIRLGRSTFKFYVIRCPNRPRGGRPQRPDQNL